MILRVGPFLYRVHFVEDELVHEGERCLGLCDNETHDIYVAAGTSFAQQVQIICHEYMEAWLYHFGHGEPSKEAYCDLFGMAMAQFVMDLTHQLDALGRDAAGTSHEPGAGAAAPLRHGEASVAQRMHDRRRIATKLAQATRRAGLSVRRVG